MKTLTTMLALILSLTVSAQITGTWQLVKSFDTFHNTWEYFPDRTLTITEIEPGLLKYTVNINGIHFRDTTSYTGINPAYTKTDFFWNVTHKTRCFIWQDSMTTHLQPPFYDAYIHYWKRLQFVEKTIMSVQIEAENWNLATTIPPYTTLKIIAHINGSPPYEYEWFGNQSLTDSTVLLTLGNQTQSYFVKVRDAHNMMNVKFTIQIDPCFGIEEPVFSAKAYPNPATDYINLPFDSQLLSNTCQFIMEGQAGRVDISGLKPGIYFAKSLDNPLLISKFVKQ